MRWLPAMLVLFGASVLVAVWVLCGGGEPQKNRAVEASNSAAEEDG